MPATTAPPAAPSQRDEREVMARTAGALWLMSAAVVLGGQLLPSAPREHLEVLLLLLVPIGLHGLACLLGAGWTRATMTQHGIGSLVLYPLIGVAIWATGGPDSYIGPLLLLSAVFTGYFFPPLWRWVLTAQLVLVAATPLVYDPEGAAAANFAPWLFCFAAACAVMNVAVARLKRRLVEAERVQHVMAYRDPLTGVSNRRAFDEALTGATFDGAPFSVFFIDLDDFKAVNDAHGHREGDRVLRAVAGGCDAITRSGDVLARIGGDEFALLAFEAGAEGEERIALELERAIRRVRHGTDRQSMHATITLARFPADAADAASLMAIADRRLHARKRAPRESALVPVLTG